MNAISSSADLLPRERVALVLTPGQAVELEKLWHDHSGPMLGMLVSWCGSESHAADTLQELFLRLASSPQRFTGMKSPRAFLMVTARRVAIDLARRDQAENRRQEVAWKGESEELALPVVTDETLRGALKQAFASLPPEQLCVVEAKLFKGQTLEVIARTQGISLNTAASRLRYALDKIRDQLRPYYDDLTSATNPDMKNNPSAAARPARRLIQPLEPKRVPSVAPGLEGFAALAPDDSVVPELPIEDFAAEDFGNGVIPSDANHEVNDAAAHELPQEIVSGEASLIRQLDVIDPQIILETVFADQSDSDLSGIHEPTPPSEFGDWFNVQVTSESDRSSKEYQSSDPSAPNFIYDLDPASPTYSVAETPNHPIYTGRSDGVDIDWDGWVEGFVSYTLDNHGVVNGSWETDSDGDGVFESIHFALKTSPDGVDVDGDGVVEPFFGLDVNGDGKADFLIGYSGNGNAASLVNLVNNLSTSSAPASLNEWAVNGNTAVFAGTSARLLVAGRGDIEFEAPGVVTPVDEGEFRVALDATSVDASGLVDHSSASASSPESVGADTDSTPTLIPQIPGFSHAPIETNRSGSQILVPPSTPRAEFVNAPSLHTVLLDQIDSQPADGSSVVEHADLKGIALVEFVPASGAKSLDPSTEIHSVAAAGSSDSPVRNGEFDSGWTVSTAPADTATVVATLTGGSILSVRARHRREKTA